MNDKRAPRIIISGGGTGGHVFPAIAIADAIKAKVPGVEILFVGAQGKIEMEKVPKAGYSIEGLWISGFQRSLSFRNLLFPVKLIHSLLNARSILRKFKPQVAVGVGGYASGPLLDMATRKGIPALIQEQNSFAGITNKILGKDAELICVAFKGMEKFFPAEKIRITGNPIRKDAVDIENKRFAAAELLSLSPHKKTILLTGGSLGSGTLNKSMFSGLDKILAADVQLIWQTGKYYYQSVLEQMKGREHPNIKVLEFLHRMDLAYAASDLVISRAGAGTIAELCAVKKPAILVPSPNVAEDHQTKNAVALVENDAAIMVGDSMAELELIDIALLLIDNKDKCKTLSDNIGKMALPDADEVIAREVLRIAKD